MKKWVWEKERERDQWTLGVMAGGASGGGNLCTGMSRDRVSSGVVCDPDIDSHHHDMSSLSCGQLSSSVVHQATFTQSSLTEFAQRKIPWMSLKMRKFFCMSRWSICIMNVSWRCSPRSEVLFDHNEPNDKKWKLWLEKMLVGRDGCFLAGLCADCWARQTPASELGTRHLDSPGH